jgi:hypothetical protein
VHERSVPYGLIAECALSTWNHKFEGMQTSPSAQSVGHKLLVIRRAQRNRWNFKRREFKSQIRSVRIERRWVFWGQSSGFQKVFHVKRIDLTIN